MVSRRKILSRRNFIKTGLIWIPAVSAKAVIPAPIGFLRKAMAGGGGGGAPTFDFASTAFDNGGPSSLTFSHTVSGSNRYLALGFCFFGDGVATTSSASAPTYNGVALSNLASRNYGSFVRFEFWRLINPDTGAHNVVITGAAATDQIIAIASSWNGVHQTTPEGTTAQADGDSGTSTVDVSSAVGETVIDFVQLRGDPGTYSPGAGQTQRAFVESGNSYPDMGHSSEAGAATVTMSATITSSVWGVVGVSLKPA